MESRKVTEAPPILPVSRFPLASRVLATNIALANRVATAYDVAPTLCALMGFPASSEMQGTSLVRSELPRITSYGPRAGQPENVKLNDEYYQSLKSLGYIR